MSTSREKPILMSAPMVRAILDGSKTQTRRIVKPQGAILTDAQARALGVRPPDQENQAVIRCPYGTAGDKLWVRETSIIAPKHFADPDETCIKDFDGDWRYVQYLATSPDREGASWYKLKATPSIFMPHWASRIDLEVTAVRVERLQDISEDDAVAEGIELGKEGWRNYHNGSFEFAGTLAGMKPATNSYRTLWESINGPGSWDTNPFVWVIEFKRIKP